MVGHSRIGITTTLLRENLSLGGATLRVKGTGCEGRGKKVASILEETKVMVLSYSCHPGQMMGRGGGKRSRDRSSPWLQEPRWTEMASKEMSR